MVEAAIPKYLRSLYFQRKHNLEKKKKQYRYSVTALCLTQGRLVLSGWLIFWNDNVWHFENAFRSVMSSDSHNNPKRQGGWWVFTDIERKAVDTVYPKNTQHESVSEMETPNSECTTPSCLLKYYWVIFWLRGQNVESTKLSASVLPALKGIKICTTKLSNGGGKTSFSPLSPIPGSFTRSLCTLKA